jgi:hypothetical protein
MAGGLFGRIVNSVKQSVSRRHNPTIYLCQNGELEDNGRSIYSKLYALIEVGDEDVVHSDFHFKNLSRKILCANGRPARVDIRNYDDLSDEERDDFLKRLKDKKAYAGGRDMHPIKVIPYRNLISDLKDGGMVIDKS